MGLSILKRVTSLFQHKPEKPAAEMNFASRFHRFKLFLGAYIEAYSEMMSFEERLANPRPFGMPFLRTCTAKLTVAVMQCMMQLNALSGGRYGNLGTSFASLRKEVQTILGQGLTPIKGPFVLAYTELDDSHTGLVSPSLLSLAPLIRRFPDQAPHGFVLTSAAWWTYFDNKALHEELDRIMVISQDEPGSYSAAAARIREEVNALPLPPDMEAAVSQALREIQDELSTPGKILLVRTLAVKAEHGALVMPEQVLKTPCSEKSVFDCLRTSFARMYQPRAILYRLKLGIRDRTMPFCWALSLLPENHARGSAHRILGNGEGVHVHLRRTPDTAPHPAAPERDSTAMYSGGSLGAHLSHPLEKACVAALDSLYFEKGVSHEFFWALDDAGACIMLGASALPEPEPLSIEAARTAASPKTPGFCHRIEGGLCTFPGIVYGQPFPVRNTEDALFFPIGSILLVPQAVPRWSYLLDFARGAVAGDGTGNGLFARTARRYGRPAILSLPDAVSAYSPDEEICLAASPESAVVMALSGAGHPVDAPCPPAEEGQGAYPLEHNRHSGLLWMPESEIGRMAKDLAPHLLSVTLPDNDPENSTSEACASFHDFLLFSYDRAVREMLDYNTTRKSAEAPAKQLVCEVPKQFWVIDLADGFTERVTGPVVRLEQIASIPMRAFWQGFMAKPWDGPPQIDTKGLISVFFEATVNPELVPGVQSTRFVEKNIFMIAKHFCSVRCRFGFHFLSLDCLLSERTRERFIVFQFKGGAANISRRIRRVHFVAELLGHFGLTTEVVADTLTARLEQGEKATFIAALRVIGYLMMHTRQLDMIMGDEEALAAHRDLMLADMRELVANEGTIKAAVESED